LDFGAQRQEFGRREDGEVDDGPCAGAIEDLAAGRINGTQDAARCRRLAAAAFADEA